MQKEKSLWVNNWKNALTPYEEMNDFIPSQNIFNDTFRGFYSSLHFTLPSVLCFCARIWLFCLRGRVGLGLSRSVPLPFFSLVNPSLSSNKMPFLYQREIWGLPRMAQAFSPLIHSKEAQIHSLKWIDPAWGELSHFTSLCIPWRVINVFIYFKSIVDHHQAVSMRSFLVHHPWRCLPTSSG